MTEVMTEPTRSRRLKAATHAVHDVLDKSIMAGNIFASREQFAKFMRVQYRFHRDLDALYANPSLAALIPDLAGRRRLPKIASDLADLGQPLPAEQPGKLNGDTSLPTALGWLYVVEGSNMGGAILFKMAREKLGLDQNHGVSHLAAHPDGVARHWREFTAALDGVQLTPEQEDEAVQGAESAFLAVQGYVREEMG